MRDYEKFYGRERDRVEILDVSDIKDVRLKYRNDVILVKLDAVSGAKSLFAAFQAQQYLEEESAYLQRLADRGVDLVPGDLKADQLTDWIRPQAFSQEESGLLQEINDLDQLTRTHFPQTVIASAARQSRRGNERRSWNEIAIRQRRTSLLAMTNWARGSHFGSLSEARFTGFIGCTGLGATLPSDDLNPDNPSNPGNPASDIPPPESGYA